MLYKVQYSPLFLLSFNLGYTADLLTDFALDSSSCNKRAIEHNLLCENWTKSFCDAQYEGTVQLLKLMR